MADFGCEKVSPVQCAVVIQTGPLLEGWSSMHKSGSVLVQSWSGPIVSDPGRIAVQKCINLFALLKKFT